MDQLGCKRYCCRRMIMTHVDLIEKLLRLVSLLLASCVCRANPYSTGITQLRETVRKLRYKHNFFFSLAFLLSRWRNLGAYYRLLKTLHPINHSDRIWWPRPIRNTYILSVVAVRRYPTKPLGSFWYAAMPGINTSNFCGNGPSGCTPISSTTGYSVEYPALYGILIYSRYFCSINDNVLSRACYCLHKCPRRISSHLTFAACQPDKTSTSRRLYRWAYTIGVWHVYTPQFYVCCHLLTG